MTTRPPPPPPDVEQDQHQPGNPPPTHTVEMQSPLYQHSSEQDSDHHHHQQPQEHEHHQQQTPAHPLEQEQQECHPEQLQQYYQEQLPPDAILLTTSRSSLSSPWSTLPHGWETATSPVDGRIYYWEAKTGRTSWAHPSAPTQGTTMTTSAMGTPTRGPALPPLPPPPPPASPSLHDYQVGGVSKESLLPHHMHSVKGSPSSPLRNPFQGWGQFFSGGYQSAIPSSASVSSHGSASNNPRAMAARSEWLDTPINGSLRPSSHQCHAMAAFILFPPLGVCAFMHSFQVDRAWRQGRYGDAFDHSKQARSYASFACWIGVCLWIYWLLVVEDGWPDNWKLE